MKPLYLIIGCILLCIAIFLTYLRERRKSQRLLESVLQELDAAIAGNLLDITYDESLDAAIRERLNRVVEIAGMRRDKAEKERDTVKSLISDIAHQVRTPLSNILLYSELLEESLSFVSEQYADADCPASGNPASKEQQESPGISREGKLPESPGISREGKLPESSGISREGKLPESPGISSEGILHESSSISSEDILHESSGISREGTPQASSGISREDTPPASSNHALESALQMAEKIRRQSEKLDFFIHELTQTSYAEQEMFSIHPQRVSAAELVNRACQGIELPSMKKDIHIHRVEGCMYSADPTSFENCAYSGDSAHFGNHAGSAGGTCTVNSSGSEDCTCFADPRWTVEALVNILENAIKYSPQASVVEISVIPYEAFVCIEVKDHGIGIEESEQGAIFRRFYRSPQVSDTPGFGIGLYLAREVLSRQGGYIKVQSAPGAGSTFQVFLSKLSPLRKI